jgi:ADP-ribose pyrophosphatase YjhB (NUDIX family)
MADATFVSRRDTAFREFPPASAQLALIVPFYGDLTVWVRRDADGGWGFPVSTRRSGETILEVAKRELWDSARIVASRLDLLGAIRSTDPKPATSYVYMCEVRHVPWGYEVPSDIAEIGVFTRTPRPLASDLSEVVLEAALRARRTGLR